MDDDTTDLSGENPRAPGPSWRRAILPWILLAAATGRAEEISFERDVRPILRDHCLLCHDANRKKGGLDLSSYTALLEGGAGGPVVEAGDPGSSRLFLSISHQAEPKMPPNQDRLDDALLDTVRRWIEGGLLEREGGRRQEVESAPGLSMAAVQAAPSDARPLPVRLPLEPFCVATRPFAPTAVSASPRAPLVAIAGQRQILLYELETLRLAGILPFEGGQPRSLRFSPDGRFLIAGGGEGARRGFADVFDVTTGARVLRAGDEADELLDADIRADLLEIAAGGPGRTVRRFDARDGSAIAPDIAAHSDWITAVAYSPDGVLLATGDRSGGLFVWEAFSGLEYLNLDAQKEPVDALAWRPDSNVLASAGADGNVRLFEMNEGRLIKTVRAHAGGALDVAFGPDGSFATAGRDRMIRVYDPSGAEQRALGPLLDAVLSVAVSFDGTKVVASDWSGVVRVFDRVTGAALGDLDQNPPTIGDRIHAARAVERAAAARLAEAKERERGLATAEARVAAEARQASAAREAALSAVAEAAAAIAAIERDLETLARERENAALAHRRAEQDLDARLGERQAVLARVESAAAAVSRAEEEAGQRETLSAVLAQAAAAAVAQAEADPDIESAAGAALEAARLAREALRSARERLARDREELAARRHDLERSEAAVADAEAAVLEHRGRLERLDADVAARRAELAKQETLASKRALAAAPAIEAAARLDQRLRLVRADLDGARRDLEDALAALADARREVARWEAERINLLCLASRRELEHAIERRDAKRRAHEDAARAWSEAADAAQEAVWERDRLLGIQELLSVSLERTDAELRAWSERLAATTSTLRGREVLLGRMEAALLSLASRENAPVAEAAARVLDPLRHDRDLARAQAEAADHRVLALQDERARTLLALEDASGRLAALAEDAGARRRRCADARAALARAGAELEAAESEAALALENSQRAEREYAQAIARARGESGDAVTREEGARSGQEPDAEFRSQR